MNNPDEKQRPDRKALHEAAVEMLELQDAGRWTIEAWERLVKKATVAANGNPALVEPFIQQKPGGLKLEMKGGVAYLS